MRRADYITEDTPEADKTDTLTSLRMILQDRFRIIPKSAFQRGTMESLQGVTYGDCQLKCAPRNYGELFL